MRGETEIPTVAVVVPTGGNRPATLRRLIESIGDDPACHEIIVVLDHESPATRATVATLAERDARVRLLEISAPTYHERDRGQASRDVGFRHARSEVILSLDDDLEPEPGLVTAHAKRHADQARLVVVGYAPVAAPVPIPGHSRAATQLYSESYERACARFREGSEDVLLGLWGGHFSVRREDWLMAEERASPAPAGSPQEAVRHIDRALGFRLRDAGLDSVFEPSIVAVHRHHRELHRIASDAHSLGYGAACLHLAYPGLVDPPAEAVRARVGGRQAIWLSRSGRLSGLATRFLTGATRLAAGLRWDWLERIGVRALSLFGYARGVHAARSDLGEQR